MSNHQMTLFSTPAKPRQRARTKKAAVRAGRGKIARLKVTLQDIRPPVWRRLEVPMTLSLGALHQILQIAFGWTDSHLHQFHLGLHRYGMMEDEFDDELLDENHARLDQLVPIFRRFVYEYDFGDSWMHRIALEKRIARQRGLTYPRCTGGKRAGPPEDCGGPFGYADFLEAMDDPSHEEHQSVRDWIGGPFDPDAFDLVAVNRRLDRLVKARRWVRS